MIENVCSSAQLLTVREEERRRLRRDLHDGLGPLLVATMLKVDAVDNLVDDDPAAAHEQLNQVRTQVQTALADIRRIAYNLRPPALDELGLLPALKEYLDAYNMSSALHIDFDAPEHLPPLSAALEGAIYRIVVEAITNVKRHANAQHCRVRLSLDESLCLEITDDGQGLQPGVRYGVGLIAMQERAAELGGTCQVEARSGRGTRVTAQLPWQGRVTEPGPAPHDDDERDVMAVSKSAASGETMQSFLNNISRLRQGRGEHKHS